MLDENEFISFVVWTGTNNVEGNFAFVLYHESSEFDSRVSPTRTEAEVAEWVFSPRYIIFLTIT